MDYNKRRWLERQQQQQGEKPRKEYEAIRHTYFSKEENYYYVANVKVFERYSTIDLSIERYEQEINAPFWAKLFLRLLESGNESEEGIIVPTRVISNNEIVKHVIKRMITDYEIALYQEYMVMEEDEDLKIEYDEELRARLQRRPRVIDEAEPEQRASATPGNYEISDFFAEEPTEEEKKEQRVQELSLRDGVDPAKYRNLKPFQVITNNKKTS